MLIFLEKHLPETHEEDFIDPCVGVMSFPAPGNDLILFHPLSGDIFTHFYIWQD